MVSYPIYVKRNTYRGRDARKQAKASSENRDASILEDTVNRLLKQQTQPIKTYLWSEISRESGLDFEIVKRLGYSIDCGSNGFTATRPGLSQDEFDRAMRGEEV
ncbi:hypothetical protein [Pseudomonas urmiensis]|jgi:hypothetical protein|uniref:Uncharacterized protein n=1 Tax=Pseudomonas urmiensis TaxID=2745493 RepID=A0A923FYQ6_9PSED|nr:hypothetical protein [Pseudomonas urmiensis]MBV4536874.1 hypothetical protein [Pseudomonas urmiensis]